MGLGTMWFRAVGWERRFQETIHDIQEGFGKRYVLALYRGQLSRDRSSNSSPRANKQKAYYISLD